MNHEMQLRYGDVLRDLDGFDDWLLRLGVPVRNADRAHHAIRVLKSAEQAFLSQTEDAGVSKEDYLFGLTEALELRDVYVAFRDHPSRQICDRLTRALSGPRLPGAETETNRDGRNVMFELALGAEWALRGAEIEFVEPDLAYRTPDRSYLVACKRPEHEHGIRASVRGAASQLRRALASAPDNCLGIIAISLSRVLNRGNSCFSGGYEQLSELLNRLMDVHRTDWHTTEFHPRNLAILFYAHTPADWGRGLFRLNALRVGPTLTEGATHQNLRDDLTRLYSKPDGVPLMIAN